MKDVNDQKICEIGYDIKTDLNSVSDSVFTVLNNMTGYNHLMNVNEQLLKHDLRLKFMLESLSILQKTFKNKGSQNALKVKATIVACLLVIDSLTNFKHPLALKLTTIPIENYYNSIRASVCRDNTQQGFVYSLIKSLNDLLSEVIDVNLKSNAEIIKKAVAILKTLADFISIKKKQKKQLEEHKHEEGKEQVVEADSSENVDMHNEEASIEEQPVENVDEEQEEQEDEEDNALSEESSEDENMEEDEADNAEEELEEEEEEEEEDIEAADLIMYDDGEDLESDDEEWAMERLAGDPLARMPQLDIVNVNQADIMRQFGQRPGRAMIGDRGVRQSEWS